jgi:hypothetical protein
MVRQFINAPSSPEIDEAREKFAAINAYITERGGWLVSVPGAPEVTMECLPDSAPPNDLRALGYDVREIGDGERILPHRIVERFTRRADGELEPVNEGSTKPIAETRTHAGIVKVRRYSFSLA